MFTDVRQKSTAAIAAAILMLAALAPASAQSVKKNPAPFNVLPTVITSVTPVGGQLVANGLVGTTPFSAPITVTPRPAQDNGACPILNLSLAPIHLSLLGLNVDTSAICLDVTAIPGGGLLGDLLCGIANLLSGGTPLADVLAGLSPQQLSTLDRGLTQMLNQAVFIPLSRSDALQNATCDVLGLALGPLDLNLLGLRVELNDCAAGPVTLDITATAGGGLLGDLLCGLGNLLQGNATHKILDALGRIAQALGGLVG